MRLVPCSPPAGLAHDAMVHAPVTSVASALLAHDGATRIEHAGGAEPALHAFWDLSEESGTYYLRAETLGGERAAWYRIDVEDELDARAGAAQGGDAAATRGHAGSMCLVGRWRRGEAAPVLYARETVRARVRAHRARMAGATRAAMRGASDAASAATGTTGDRLVGHGISDA